MVCGRQRSETKKPFPGALAMRRHMVIASAAAVPSSSSEALASTIPVRSAIMVW